MQILGVRVDNVTMVETLAKIRGFLVDGEQHYITTINPDFLVKAQRDKEFKEILNKADLNVTDGVGVIWASWLMGKTLKGRIAGVDLIENCKLNIENLKIFLLGGFNGAAGKIAGVWPAVVGFSEDIDSKELFTLIRECNPNLLLIALGAPKQEQWIAQNLSKIPSVKIAIGVGSAFNLISGQIKRAPKFLRTLGLEWFWRLFVERHRWHKVFRSVLVFPLLLIREKILGWHFFV